MTIHEAPVWIIDAQTVGRALAYSLTKALDRPVHLVLPESLPTEPCALLIVEILLPDACGLTVAASLRTSIEAPGAVWSTAPQPLYSWVAWQIGLHSCLDKDMDWQETVTLIQNLMSGASLWPPAVWERIQAFEGEFGWRLRRLNETDWERWLDLIRQEPLKNLARRWGLSLRGAAKARERLCDKLEVAGPIEAQRLAWYAELVKIHREWEWSEAITLYRRHSQLSLST